MLIKTALKLLEIKSLDFSEKELRDKFKKCLLTSDIFLSEICESALILYKSLRSLIAGEVWHEIFQDCIEDAIFSSQKVSFRIRGFDSLVHHLLFKELQLKFKSDFKVDRNVMKVRISDINIPYDRSKKSFGELMILGNTVSRRVLSLVLEGTGAMLFVAFYLKPILTEFWKKVQTSGIKEAYLPEESLVSKDEDFQPSTGSSSTKSSDESSPQTSISVVLTPPRYDESNPTSRKRSSSCELPSPGRSYASDLRSPSFEDTKSLGQKKSKDSNELSMDTGAEFNESGNRSPIILSTKKRLQDFEKPQPRPSTLSIFDSLGLIDIIY